MKVDINYIEKVLFHQLNNFVLDVDKTTIKKAIPTAIDDIEKNFRGIANTRFYNGDVVFSPLFSIHWMIFLYRLSRVVYLNEGGEAADQIYYLNKILHSIDWYYAIDLPVHFLCEHPLGSVLGRAKYGDYFFIYQNTTVGGNWKNDELKYPTLGNNVVMFANSTILGDSHIGKNVVVSAETYLLNETIPDNSIVFGKSPNITIKKKTEDEIMQYINHAWRGKKNSNIDFDS